MSGLGQPAKDKPMSSCIPPTKREVTQQALHGRFLPPVQREPENFGV
jgi:hypothetical protein